MHIAFELGCSGICINRVMADFMQKQPNFCYHGNKGRSRENLNGSTKSAVAKNRLSGANLAALAMALGARPFVNP